MRVASRWARARARCAGCGRPPAELRSPAVTVLSPAALCHCHGRGWEGERGKAESGTLCIASIHLKLFPALQVRRCIPAFTASHGKVCKKQAVCALFNASSCYFDLCARLCLCRQHLYSSLAAPGQSFLSQTNLMAISFPAELSSH